MPLIPQTIRRAFTSLGMEVSLRDGSKVYLRPLKSSDKDLLVAGFARLSLQSRYQRFFTLKEQLSSEELRYFTEVDGHHHVAVGALRYSPQGQVEGLGIARYIVLDPTTKTAEAAVTVIDEMQSKGLGTVLLQHLIKTAREHGIRRFACDVLASNTKAQAFLKEVASDVEVCMDGDIAHIEFPIIDPDKDPLRNFHELPIFRVLSSVAEGVLRVVQWLHPRDE